MPVTPIDSYDSSFRNLCDVIDGNLRAGVFEIALSKQNAVRFGYALKHVYHSAGWMVAIDDCIMRMEPVFEPQLQKKDERSSYKPVLGSPQGEPQSEDPADHMMMLIRNSAWRDNMLRMWQFWSDNWSLSMARIARKYGAFFNKEQPDNADVPVND